jgi:hypothetical protein
MSRNVILFLIFILLGGATAWYMTNKEDEHDSMAALRAERDFATDPDIVHKVFIADRQGERTTLVRKKGYWEYNGEWKARPNAIENLLSTIEKVQMKYKPPAAAEDDMIRDLATNGLKVELYDQNNELIKAYYVGGGTADERGTYMMMEGAEQPFVAYIPNWEGNLRFRFSLRGDDWRDKTVFSYDMEEIQSVSVEYPKQKNKSFILERDGSSFKVKPYYDITPESSKPYKQGSAESFLIGFENLVAEAYKNDREEKDSVIQQIPFSVISVTDIEGNTKEVKFHPLLVDDFYDTKTGTFLANSDIERFYAECSTGDFMMIQNRVFNKIFWSYDFFFS